MRSRTYLGWTSRHSAFSPRGSLKPGRVSLWRGCRAPHPPGDNNAVGNTKKLSLVLAGLILSRSLVACDDGRGGAEAAAKQLASAVAGLDLGPVAFDGRDSTVANDQLNQVFKALAPAKPSVEAGELTLDGDTARVPLNYSWKISTGEWKYTVSADLRKSGDKWLTVWSPGLLVPNLAEGEILSKATQSSPRADILGAGNQKLVTLRPVVNVGIDKPQLGGADAADSATKLAKLVGVDPAAYVQQVEASGAEAFVPAITLRNTSDRAVTDAEIEAIPGGRAIPDELPLAPTRNFARAVLGTVGEASAEQIEKSNGTLTAGDVIGTGGLQQQYDAQLRGTDGTVVRVQRADLTREEIQAAPTDPRRTVFEVKASSRHAVADHPRHEAAAACRGHPCRHQAGVRHRGAPAVHRSGPGRRIRTRKQRLQHRHARPVRAGIHLQGGGLPGHDAQRIHPRFHRRMHAHAHRRRPEIQERRGLSQGLARIRDPARRLRALLQHRLHCRPGQGHPGPAGVCRHLPRGRRGGPEAGRRSLPWLRSRRGRGHRTRRRHDRPGQGADVPAGRRRDGRLGGEGLPRGPGPGGGKAPSTSARPARRRQRKVPPRRRPSQRKPRRRPPRRPSPRRKRRPSRT